MLFSLIRGQLDFPTALANILAILVIVFLVLPFHEWAHAFAASKLGDTSIQYRGRLTLNPLAHIDPFGALALLLFGFGWAKPVPVDSSKFKSPKAGMALVAAMGPFANIVAALLGLLVFNILKATTGTFMADNTFGVIVYNFLSFYVIVNIRLAVFNLLPIPPLDGSKILFLFLPDKAVMWFYRYQQIISIVLIALLWMGVLSIPLNYLSNLLLQGLSWLAGLPFSFK